MSWDPEKEGKRGASKLRIKTSATLNRATMISLPQAKWTYIIGIGAKMASPPFWGEKTSMKTENSLFPSAKNDPTTAMDWLLTKRRASDLFHLQLIILNPIIHSFRSRSRLSQLKNEHTTFKIRTACSTSHTRHPPPQRLYTFEI